MPEPTKQWTSRELFDICQSRRDLFPRGFEFREADGWCASRGLRSEPYVVGAPFIQGKMLETANRLLGRSGENALTDLSAALTELNAKRPGEH